jgi:hypothetical protein
MIEGVKTFLADYLCPEKTTSYSYTTDWWYLGVFAWVFIAAVIGYGIYIVDGLVRRGGPGFIWR